MGVLASKALASRAMRTSAVRSIGRDSSPALHLRWCYYPERRNSIAVAHRVFRLRRKLAGIFDSCAMDGTAN